MKGAAFFEKMAGFPGMSGLSPEMAGFFQKYLSAEKAVPFGDQWVVNTQFPPFPGKAAEGLAAQLLDTSGRQHLYSVTLAVTNRCFLKCWHCYNAGRDSHDMPVDLLRQTAARLQDLGAVMINLTGGEPLLRPDLEEICSAYDSRSCVIVGTTGWGLDARRARSLRASGVFGVGISIDSSDEAEHDRRRGRAGAFRAAANGLAAAAEAGLYPYAVSVATREFLDPGWFYAFLRRVGELGAREVHLLEPCPTGRIAGRKDLVLTPDERRQIIAYQHEVAAREDLPILSTYTYLESPDNFGCGAGLTHLYIDGSGELCPCNLVPLSFGNITREPLDILLARMRRHFREPRAECAGKTLAPHIHSEVVPAPPDVSEAVCERHLARDHALPGFFQLRAAARAPAGADELARAYNQVSGDYDDFWLGAAGTPAADLVERLPWKGGERVFEAGCGSGFATVRLAARMGSSGRLIAVDLSEGMQLAARRRVEGQGLGNVEFRLGDALTGLQAEHDLDLVFSSWVLGYIPVPPFLSAAARALKPGGTVAFIVHRENSPRREFELFSQLVARDPSVLLQTVSFGFPRDAGHVREELAAAGLTAVEVWEGTCSFFYPTAEKVLEHLLKSGAGTVFYEALDPARRGPLTREFLERLETLRDSAEGFWVRHDYVACVARTGS